MNGWMHGWMGELMDRWTGEWMHGWMGELILKGGWMNG